MLSKKHRLTTPQFTTVLETGSTIRSPFLYCKVVRTTEFAAAVAVPKKLVKTSVGRHLVKRRFFAAVTKVQHIFPVGHYIFFATPQTVTLSVVDLERYLTELAHLVASRS